MFGMFLNRIYYSNAFTNACFKSFIKSVGSSSPIESLIVSGSIWASFSSSFVSSPWVVFGELIISDLASPKLAWYPNNSTDLVNL